MDRVAVFVDAGYVFAQGSILLAGKKLPRGEVVLDHGAAVDALTQFAEKVSGAQLLRIYCVRRDVHWTHSAAPHARPPG